MSLTAGDVGADASGAAAAAQAASLQVTNNLSDLNSASTARTNLGLGGAATLNVGTTTGTVAAGDDSRIAAASTAVQSVNGKTGSAITLTTGDVVGTTDMQTLTNKTLDGASNTFTNIPKTALANIDESQVTNLTADLGNKLAKPATAFAKGSLLVGTGAGTYDTLAVGATGTVPTVSGGTLVYTAPPSGTLGSTAYSGSVAMPITSTALDTTNLTITFAAPASGKILLRVSTYFDDTQLALYLGWYQHGTTTAVGSSQAVCGGIANATGAARLFGEQIITGLTPGQSYTYDLRGNAQTSGSHCSDFVLTAWAA